MPNKPPAQTEYYYAVVQSLDDVEAGYKVDRR